MSEEQKLIDHALKWLDEKEPDWKLSTPINREEFLKVLKEKFHDSNRVQS